MGEKEEKGRRADVGGREHSQGCWSISEHTDERGGRGGGADEEVIHASETVLKTVSTTLAVSERGKEVTCF